MLVVDEPIGWRIDGRPIWPFLGGSEGSTEDDGAGDGDDDGGDDDGTIDAEGFTKGGRKAIEAERLAAKQARDALRPWRVLARELGVKSPEEIKALVVKDKGAQVDADQIRREAEQAAEAKVHVRIVRSEIKALAADSFADPADAVLNLNPEDYEVDGDGNVDERRLKSDLADLLKRKPHLAKTSKKVDYEGGARKTAEGKVDMNSRIRDMAHRR